MPRVKGDPTQIRSINDIARLAGVSASTVSRALADNPLIARRTRQRIQAIARDAGFSVNPAARTLRTRQSKTIGLVLPLGHEKAQHLSDPFFTAMLGLLADQVSRRGYDLLLRRVEPTSNNWLRAIVESRRVDGIIVIGQSDQERVLDEMGEEFKPLVVWGQWLPTQKYLTVGVDNVAGGRLAGEHLLSRGRQNLAFLGNTDVPEFKARYEGFLAVLPPKVRKAHAHTAMHLTSQDSYADALAYLEAHPKTDGVFAASDVIAMSVIRAAVACGKRVPEDISVVGFDDVALAAQSNPPLTTIRQDLDRGSSLLCDLLFQRMKGEHCTSVLLPPSLVCRASS